MDFTELCGRLLGRLRRLLDAGVISESALSRRLGVSQSHLHNTLKGVRSLTVSTADQFLRQMGWTVHDLLDDSEMRAEIARRKSSKSKMRELPVRSISAMLGGSCQAIPGARHSIPRALLAGVSEPALIAVDSTADPGGIAESGDILLADFACGRDIRPDSVYLVQHLGKFRLRWIRKGARCFYLLGNAEWNQPSRWERVEDVRPAARIHAIAKQPSDMFQRPVPPSGAS